MDNRGAELNVFGGRNFPSLKTFGSSTVLSVSEFERLYFTVYSTNSLAFIVLDPYSGINALQINKSTTFLDNPLSTISTVNNLSV
jgi:hypothetical protein